jgi:GTP cyclohydrolase II
VHATPDNLRYLHAKVEHTHHNIALAAVPSLAG